MPLVILQGETGWKIYKDSLYSYIKQCIVRDQLEMLELLSNVP